MAREINTVLLHLLMILWLIGTLIQPSVVTESDVYCLKSIKDSLQDPHNHLSSWVFTSRKRAESFICSFAGVECWSSVEKIMHIKLNDMGLKGQFPSGLQNCTSLTGLDLSNNNLEGPIPFDVEKIIPRVVSLDLSYNKLSGEIPSNIAGCSYLNVLKLDHNLLQGQIPPQISHLNRLRNFDVSYNLLSGKIPDHLPLERDSYTNNSGLCGKPLDVCPEERQRFKFEYKSFKSGFLIGYVVFFVSVAVVFVSYCVPWLDVKSKKKKITVGELMMLNFMTRKSRRVSDDQVVVLAPASKVQQERRKQISALEKIVERMSLTDLCNATGNFSHHNLIGAGQTGIMYKATVGGNGWLLAVKRLHDIQHLDEQLVSEVKTLGRLRHQNLLPLIGFCIKSSQRLLVYKYMSNGNLFDRLHRAPGTENSIMEWPFRMKIAIGVARGLAWLHHGCSPRVAHLNISSKCVLLDQKFKPKLSNFERAMSIDLDGMDDLSSSYSIHSEFLEWGFFKKDVFSFGIVLLELITGEEVLSHSNSLSLDGRLASLINDMSSSLSYLNDVIDKFLVGKGFEDEIFKLLRVACRCIQPLPERRPSMLHVLKTIAAVGKWHGFEHVTEEFPQLRISATQALALGNSGDEIVEMQ